MFLLIGAKFVRQSKVGPLNDSVERKLHATSEAGKRKAAKSVEESFPSTREGHNGNDKDIDDDDSDGESENRTSAFAKKRAGPPTSSLQERRTQLPYSVSAMRFRKKIKEGGIVASDNLQGKSALGLEC
ncbi:hypothetical protein GH714_005106 [Hevea brasiliensis]|uniref:Uncharacterized protein n=1 Tax=Hevea brasiliensis TaxID=3981 RepID=A0A6A6KXT5_HEVBR|nr:hypothetical protein GH714_005106 [Hevea brasiliensis]